MSLPVIKYPYLPEGREYLYVDLENEFMRAAKAKAEIGGCRKHANAAVIVKDGTIVSEGSNAGVFVSVCPRAYKGYPTGEGYHYCKNYCDQEGHSEVVAINNAKANGVDVTGADIYLYGHWWMCQNCWNHMIEAGINKTYLFTGSEKLFNYEFQQDDKIDPQPTFSLYVSGPLTRLKNPDIKPFFEEIGALAETKGFSVHVPHLYTDPIKQANLPADEVYKIDSEQVRKADLMICYVGETSLGAGMEIEMANRYKTLVILISEHDIPVSRLALGSPNIIEHIIFSEKEEALQQLAESLTRFVTIGSQQNVSIKR